MRWEFDASAVGVAFKAEGISGDLGGLGESLPPGGLAVLSVNVRRREFVLWLFPGDVRHVYSLDTLPVEDAGPGLPTGRIDVTGSPALTYHDGFLKAFYAQFGGGQVAESLFRFNTGFRLVP